MFSITKIGRRYYHPMYDYFDGIRSVTSYSSIASKITHERINQIGIKEVCFGEYPQTVLSQHYDRYEFSGHRTKKIYS